MPTSFPRLLGLFLPAVLLLLAAFGPQDDERALADFRRYFKKHKDTPTRVEAVLSLEGLDSVGLVTALTPVLKDADRDVVRAAVQVLSEVRHPETVKQLFRVFEKKHDVRTRFALLEVFRAGDFPGSGDVALGLLRDASWELRRAAILTLATLTADAEEVDRRLLDLTDDGELAVRCAALETLGKRRAPAVLEPALRDLESDSWQLRACAIRTLGLLRRREAIEPLLLRMEREDGRLIVDIGDALEEITGRPFGMRLDAWQRFWERYREEYVVPTDAQLAELRKTRLARDAFYRSGSEAVQYHGIPTPSRRVLFVLDVSGSMEQEVMDRERFADAGYESFQRIDIVKVELIRTLRNLDSSVRFNVLAFATEVEEWKRNLVPASTTNKRAAADWVERLEVHGRPSGEYIVGPGQILPDDDIEAGRTNTFAALMASLGLNANGDPVRKTEVQADTVFFLSDGRPSEGRYIDPTDILREVRTANALRQVVFHTISIGEFQKAFLQTLAGESGGLYVDLGE